MFPFTEIKVIIEYLRGTGNHSLKEVAKACLTILTWATDFLPEGPKPMLIANASSEDMAGALDGFVKDYQDGTMRAALPVPACIIPIILEILKRLFAH